MKKMIKTLYESIPFKGSLFALIRPLNLPQSIYQHLHFKGKFKSNIDGNSFSMMHYGFQVENDLFWAGFKNWESVSLDLWKKLSKQSKTIIDVGANTGIYSLIAGAVNRTASIYAFEPLVFNQLQTNVRLNNFNITPLQIAASNSNGVATFFTDSTDFSYTASLNKSHFEEFNKIELKVKTQTLDSFCEENNLIPDLVKIDVERYEPEVIEGFMGTIKRHLPTMLIEVLDESIGSRLNELLKDVSYRYYSINETKGTCKQIPQINKSEEFNILACTEQVANAIGLMRSV